VKVFKKLEHNRQTDRQTNRQTDTDVTENNIMLHLWVVLIRKLSVNITQQCLITRMCIAELQSTSVTYWVQCFWMT